MPTLSSKCHHSWKKNMLSRLQILLHGASSPGAGLPPAPPGCGRLGGTRPNGFHLAAMLGEGETAAFKFSTRNLSESSPHPPPPIPLGPFCGCLMHLATLNRYLPRGQGRPPARRGEGRMGPAPGRLLFALTQREPPSLRHKYIFHTCE